MLTHFQLWAALDLLAVQLRTTPVGLAKMAGLHPTVFNRSKRGSGKPGSRLKWPSTQSIARVLSAAGVSFTEFARLTENGNYVRRGVPLIGVAQAGEHGFFDDAGFPVGEGWDEIDLIGGGDGLYALEIAGDQLLPVYRPGDRLLIRPTTDPRQGNRIVMKMLDGALIAGEADRVSAGQLQLSPLPFNHPTRLLQRKDIAWVARILWVSQ